MKNRKSILFDKFSNQLTLLKSNGLIDIELKYEETYICPLCLDQFNRDDLESNDSKNYLTEEDAPPASLGGSRIALTCKNCNSRCGHNFDYQLKELIEHEENTNFIKGTVQRGRIEFEGEQLTVELKSDGTGDLQALHNIQRNNPKVLPKFIDLVKRGKSITIEPLKNRLDIQKINCAFFKSNYIITFSKFGYIFLLDKAYDELRRQLLNPEMEILKYNLTIQNEIFDGHIGTHYVLDSDIKAIFNIFKLSTLLTENVYGSFLPLPSISFESFVKGMELRIQKDTASFCKSIYDNSVDLFSDVNEIQKITKWIST